MPTPTGSPVVLHLELGGGFLLAMLDGFGVQGLNKWLDAVARSIPGYWGEGETEPPICFWFDGEGADISGRNLDGINLVLVWCQGARFDSASAVGAKFNCVSDASFRNANLRNAKFLGDISGADFRDAQLDGVTMNATYDPDHPPIGLPEALFRLCQREPDRMPKGGGLAERPVPIRASLARAYNQR